MRTNAACAGFTLVEVLVASLLLTVGLLTAVRLFASSTVANASSRKVTTATVLAVEKMEQLRALSIDDDAFAASPSGSLDVDIEGYFDRPDPRFVRRWSVEPLPAYPDDAVAVQVVVVRPDAPGRTSLETIKVRKPATGG